ncbi:MarR family winged helix-turn-helix transcriptional regulator [Marinicrinis sediminis]|uniref:MarR family winged helix-turn-helix transcriptional regulator n=1 Tax=Marinicrinis sediminis TaxID=1652465 RepID=A0ABW5R8K0_9BACL
MTEEESVLMNCLFFTTNRFARNITKMADQMFDFDDLAPSYLYMIFVIHFHPKLTQKDLCQRLSIAPSTSTRFIDKLEKKKLVTRHVIGKETAISLTDEGERMYEQFRQALKSFFDAYAASIGREFSLELSKMLHEASVKLETDRDI